MSDIQLTLPMPDSYFAECIVGAEKAGLKLIGKTCISTDSHELRNQTKVRETDIRAVQFLRHTTLYFTWPGKAFLMSATCVEETRPNYTSASRGELLVDDERHHWHMHFFIGTHPGKWQGDDDWLFIAREFDGATLHADSRKKSKIGANGKWFDLSYDHGTAYHETLEVCDGGYTTTLGFFGQTSSTLFAEAMKSTVEALAPFVRDGKLIMTFSLPYAYDNRQHFLNSFHSEVEQFPPQALLEVLGELPAGVRNEQEIVDQQKSADQISAMSY